MKASKTVFTTPDYITDVARLVRGHETVLLIEDEAMLRRAAREILELQGRAGGSRLG
jgi:hypothetical protein